MRGCRRGWGGWGGSSWKWEPELAAPRESAGPRARSPEGGRQASKGNAVQLPGTRRVPAQRRWDAGPKEEVRKALGGRAAVRAAPLLDCGSQE